MKMVSQYVNIADNLMVGLEGIFLLLQCSISNTSRSICIYWQRKNNVLFGNLNRIYIYIYSILKLFIFKLLKMNTY